MSMPDEHSVYCDKCGMYNVDRIGKIYCQECIHETLQDHNKDLIKKVKEMKTIYYPFNDKSIVKDPNDAYLSKDSVIKLLSD